MPALTSLMPDVTIPKPTIFRGVPTIFTSSQHEALSPGCVPNHIAIIPDGNRRWAEKQHTTHTSGHQHGADSLIETVKAAKELGVKALTFYTFSTENWNRPQEEIDALMWLIESYLIEQRSTMLTEGIHLDTIGDLSILPLSLQETILETKEITGNCKDVDMILAVNYGGRNEICRAIKGIISDIDQKKISKNQIDEALVSNYLDTSKWGDPGLFIRTSGEMRISNFLIWQLSYAELYVCDVLWPDFTPQHLYAAIYEFQNRERRLGH